LVSLIPRIKTNLWVDIDRPKPSSLQFKKFVILEMLFNLFMIQFLDL
jgi:hypothetical protein